MRWKTTLREFLEHSEISEAEKYYIVSTTEQLLQKLPESLREMIASELNIWQRDDFVDFNGFLKALHTVAEWFDRMSRTEPYLRKLIE